MTKAKIVVIQTDLEERIEAFTRGRYDIHRFESLSHALELKDPQDVAVVMVLLPEEGQQGSLLSQLKMTFLRAQVLATVKEDDSCRLVEAINDFEVDRCLTTPLNRQETLPALDAAAQSFELRRMDYSAYGIGISRMNKRILCVDDELDILQYYESVLAPKPKKILRRRRNRRGEKATEGTPSTPRPKKLIFEITKASSGEEAVELVIQAAEAGKPFATGFFDMKMPGGIDGLETIRQIRAIDPHINCAVATAYTDRPLEEIQAAFDDYADWMYFNKPFTTGELLQAARNQVSRWNAAQGQKNLSRFVRKLRHILGRQSLGRTPSETINLLKMICTRTLTEVLQIDGWGMLLQSEETGRFTALTHHGVPDSVSESLFSALAEEALSDQNGPIFTLKHAPESIKPFFASIPMGQLLSLPFEGDTEPLGLLFGFVSPNRSQFSRQEVELTMQLAQELSQALRMLSRRQAFTNRSLSGDRFAGFHLVGEKEHAKAS